MAKNKIVINDEELTPTVLYTKKEKKGSIIWLIIIFAIFISAVVFMPNIVAYIEDYFNPEVDTPVTPNLPVDEEDDDSLEEEDNNEYQLVDGLQIDMTDFSLNNFRVSNNQLSFTITNKTTELLDFSQMNYFINLYNANRTLLQRIMLQDEIVAASGTLNVTYDVVDSNITTIAILEITEDEYPAHIVEADTSGNATMVCTKDYETVNYLLNNNQVYAIEDIFNVPVSDENYLTFYAEYYALSSTYNNITGVDSSVTVENNVLTFRTNINLNSVTSNTLNNIIYYPSNTDAKVMHFELEANGYTCS